MNGGKDEGEKVTFCEEYNMVPCTPSNGVASFVSQASSSNVATIKPKVLPNLELQNIDEENCGTSKSRISTDASLSGYEVSKLLRENEAIATDGTSERVTRTRHDSPTNRQLTPDDVVRVFGQRLFRKARKTILHQQKVFSSQIFELHRLIKVQKLIARSKLHQKNFDPNKPPIQHPTLDKLLYTTPIDRPLPSAKPETDSLTDRTLKILTTSTSKFGPWFFPPPNGNQWLVPIKPPSEGVVYEPYHGPCFQTNGITTQIPNATGGSDVQVEQALEKDVLALFPMAPWREAMKDESEDRKSRVIRVVPHNRKSASASAARIFESLKEEREFLRLSTCASHAS